MLAAQAEYRRSRHVRVMDIPGDQSAKLARTFPSSAPAAVMQQEPHTVHIFENSGTLRLRRVSGQLACLDLVRPPVRIKLRQLRNLSPVHLRRRESQLFF